MKIAPMDVQKQQFTRRFRGYDRDEVRAYLHLVSEDVAELLRDQGALEAEVSSLRASLDEHRQRETMLKNTLLLAQRASDEIRETARKQGENAVKEAELRADRLLERAHARAHQVEQDILELRAQRGALRSDVRALLERLGRILDLHEEAETADNLRLLTPREREGGA